MRLTAFRVGSRISGKKGRGGNPRSATATRVRLRPPPWGVVLRVACVGRRLILGQGWTYLGVSLVQGVILLLHLRLPLLQPGN